MIANLITNKFTLLNIFSTPIIDVDSFLAFILRFSFDLLVTLVIVRLIYYPKNKRKDYLVDRAKDC
jgi:hypothetical protein